MDWSCGLGTGKTEMPEIQIDRLVLTVSGTAIPNANRLARLIRKRLNVSGLSLEHDSAPESVNATVRDANPISGDLLAKSILDAIVSQLKRNL